MVRYVEHGPQSATREACLAVRCVTPTGPSREVHRILIVQRRAILSIDSHFLTLAKIKRSGCNENGLGVTREPFVWVALLLVGERP